MVLNPSPYSTKDSITNNELLKKSNPENDTKLNKTLLSNIIKVYVSQIDELSMRRPATSLGYGYGTLAFKEAGEEKY